MKSLKAFVRASKLDDVIRSLEDAKAPGITVSSEHGAGYGCEPLLFTLSPSEIRKIPEIAKAEVVCSDPQVDRLRVDMRSFSPMMASRSSWML